MRLTVCARLEAGALEGDGERGGRARNAASPLARRGSAGPRGWTFLPPVFLEAEVGALLRPTNDRFYFQPDTTVYQVPLFAMSAGVGLGAHFS